MALIYKNAVQLPYAMGIPRILGVELLCIMVLNVMALVLGYAQL